MGTIASMAKEAASAMPATLIDRDARGAATAIASRKGSATCLLPDPPGDEDVVVGPERDKEHSGREGDVVGEVAVAQEPLEDVRGQPQGRRD